MPWSSIVSSRLAALCVALLGALALLAGCATKPRTTLEMTWVSPQLPPAPFKKLLIITVSAEELVQIAFQDQMAAALKARGVNAVASKRYFTRYTEAEKARFKQSIDDSGADFVLLARVTRTQRDEREDHLMTFGDATGLYSAYDRYISVAAASGGDYSVKTVTAEASIFAVQGEKMIWAARTRTANANVTTGENFAPQYIDVILEAMKKDKLL
jgi:hypothetical protein